MSKSKNAWKKDIKESQDYRCARCGQKGTDKTLNIHHMRCKAHGGASNKQNCIAWHVIFHKLYHQKYGLRTSDRYGNPIVDNNLTYSKKKRKKRKGKKKRR